MKEPCCAAAAAISIKMVTIGGFTVGIAQFDTIMNEVVKLNLKDENEIRKELLKLVKLYNYVSPNAEKDYEDAMFSEYKRTDTQERSE